MTPASAELIAREYKRLFPLCSGFASVCQMLGLHFTVSKIILLTKGSHADLSTDILKLSRNSEHGPPCRLYSDSPTSYHQWCVLDNPHFLMKAQSLQGVLLVFPLDLPETVRWPVLPLCSQLSQQVLLLLVLEFLAYLPSNRRRRETTVTPTSATIREMHREVVLQTLLSRTRNVMIASSTLMNIHAAFQSAERKDCAQVSDYSCIARGNVVAFPSEHHNRRIRIRGSEEFLVVQVTGSTFAFFSLHRIASTCA